MMKRRNLISLIAGLMLAITHPILKALAQKRILSTARQRSSPFFFGWYGTMGNPEVAAKVAPKGIDLLMPYVGEASKREILAYLDAAKAARVKVLLEIYRPLVESGNITGVKEFIRTYKNHPAVYAWYLYDEPDYKQPPLPPSLLNDVYRAIKQEDRSKPVTTICADVNKVESYSQAMDIIMWDRYPCDREVPEFQWAPAYRQAINLVGNLANTQQKKFWNVLQAYREHGQNKRLPTKAEFRYMFYTSVLAGVDGILGWMYPWSTAEWNESVFYSTLREFKAYLPAIVSNGSVKHIGAGKSSTLEIKLFLMPKTKKSIAIAINHGRTNLNSTVSLDSRLAGKAVTVNNKLVARLSARSNMKISLAPYEVRIYQIG
jgi:hypothetical protein